jgi:hypothetical protein
MSRLRGLKIFYVLAGVLLSGYWSVHLLAYHVTEHIPVSSGTLYCLILFAGVPTLGYVLLFKLFPLASRLRTR